MASPTGRRTFRLAARDSLGRAVGGAGGAAACRLRDSYRTARRAMAMRGGVICASGAECCAGHDAARESCVEHAARLIE